MIAFKMINHNQHVRVQNDKLIRINYFFSELTGYNKHLASQTTFEAREFLRTRCIGKDINVSVDSIQPKSGTYEEKVFATVKVNGM